MLFWKLPRLQQKDNFRRDAMLGVSHNEDNFILDGDAKHRVFTKKRRHVWRLFFVGYILYFNESNKMYGHDQIQK